MHALNLLREEIVLQYIKYVAAVADETFRSISEVPGS